MELSIKHYSLILQCFPNRFNPNFITILILESCFITKTLSLDFERIEEAIGFARMSDFYLFILFFFFWSVTSRKTLQFNLLTHFPVVLKIF